MTCPQLFSVKFSLSQKRFNLRENLDFAIPLTKSVNHRFESLTYLGTKTLELTPSNIRQKHSFNLGGGV